jgi:23S rRNA pseudoU1915 N3-methylase RlmH
MSTKINSVNLIIGKRGTGKTYYTQQVIAAYPNKVLVVDTFEHPAYVHLQTIQVQHLSRWKKGTKRIIINDENATELYQAINQLNYCLIVFEDASKYLSNEMSKEFKKILFDSKQRNNDVALLFHGFAYIHPRLLALCDTLTLFKTGENIESQKHKVPLYDEVIVAYHKVNNSPNRFARSFIKLI